MMCSYVIIEPNNKELECRRLIMESIDRALKRGDEVFERLMQKEDSEPNTVPYDKFKTSLKNIDHENLKP